MHAFAGDSACREGKGSVSDNIGHVLGFCSSDAGPAQGCSQRRACCHLPPGRRSGSALAAPVASACSWPDGKVQAPALEYDTSQSMDNALVVF